MLDPFGFVTMLGMAFLLGLIAGALAERRIWRLKGDHSYMNRHESSGRLYIVKREE
jgi:hypothetical protein